MLLIALHAFLLLFTSLLPQSLIGVNAMPENNKSVFNSAFKSIANDCDDEPDNRSPSTSCTPISSAPSTPNPSIPSPSSPHTALVGRAIKRARTHDTAFVHVRAPASVPVYAHISVHVPVHVRASVPVSSRGFERQQTAMCLCASCMP